MALASAQGTGTTTGPYSLIAGTLLSLNDPYIYSQAAVALQIQNNTSLLLSVQSAGSAYTIQPLTVSTIPSSGGQTITVLPSSIGYGNNNSTLSVVWLLPGQNAPMQDGPLTGTTGTNTPTPHSLTTSYNGYAWVITGWLSNDIKTTITWSGPGINTTYPYLWLGGTAQFLLGSWYAASGNLTCNVSGLNSGSSLVLYAGTSISPQVAVSTAYITSLSGTATN